MKIEFENEGTLASMLGRGSAKVWYIYLRTKDIGESSLAHLPKGLTRECEMVACTCLIV